MGSSDEVGNGRGNLDKDISDKDKVTRSSTLRLWSNIDRGRRDMTDAFLEFDCSSFQVGEVRTIAGVSWLKATTL